MTRRTLARAAGSIAAVAALALGTATAQAAVPDGGVVVAGNLTDAPAQIARAASAGVPWVSLNADWGELEPTPDSHLAPGGRNGTAWTNLLAQADAAAAARMKVLIVVRDAPQWASGVDAGNDPPTPAHYADYASFLAQLTQILGDRVDAIAPWNEPNLTSFWAQPDPRAYAALHVQAYAAIKSAAPGVLVLLAPISGVQGGPYQYLEGVYAAGVKGSVDVVAWNSYPPTTPEDAPLGADGRPVPGSLAGQRVVASILKRVDPGRRVWITEISWSTCSCGGLNVADTTRQADYLVRLFSYKRRYLAPTVERVFWYNLRDSGDRSRWSGNHGLTFADLSPKPALRQLRLIDRTLRVPAAITRQARKPVTTPSSAVLGLRLRSVKGRVVATGRVRVDGRSRIVLEGYRRGAWRTIGSSAVTMSSTFAARPPDEAYLAVRVRVRGNGDRAWARRVAIVPKAAPLRT